MMKLAIAEPIGELLRLHGYAVRRVTHSAGLGPTEVALCRERDGVSFAVRLGQGVLMSARDPKAVFDVLLRPFVEYDAQQETPSHWMAL